MRLIKTDLTFDQVKHIAPIMKQSQKYWSQLAQEIEENGDEIIAEVYRNRAKVCERLAIDAVLWNPDSVNQIMKTMEPDPNMLLSEEEMRSAEQIRAFSGGVV